MIDGKVFDRGQGGGQTVVTINNLMYMMCKNDHSVCKLICGVRYNSIFTLYAPQWRYNMDVIWIRNLPVTRRMVES